MTIAIPAESAASQSNRWTQLVLGVIAMMTISSPQYIWTLFTGAFQKTTGSLLSEVQWTITILIVLQTWLSPFQGWLVDRFGPRLLVGAGALLSGVGWIASSASRVCTVFMQHMVCSAASAQASCILASSV